MWTAARGEWQLGSGPGSLTAPRTPGDDQQAAALPSVAIGVAEAIRACGATAFPTPGAPGGRMSSGAPKGPGHPDAPWQGLSWVPAPPQSRKVQASLSGARARGPGLLGLAQHAPARVARSLLSEEQMTFALRAPPPSPWLENTTVRSQPQ